MNPNAQTARPSAQPRDNGVVFVGSKSIGLRALRMLVETVPTHVDGVVTVDDQTDGRSVLNEFQRFCLERDIPLDVLEHHHSLEHAIQRVRPVLVLVVGWYWLIPDRLLGEIPHGAVGVHASLLPDLRGSAPLVWAILKGRKRTGVSLFFLDNGIDSGDIVDQVTFEVHEHSTIADLLERSESACVELIRTHAAALLGGTARRHRQDPSKATYGAVRRPADGKLDWMMTADALYDAVRAQTKPYPGAFTRLGENIVRVWKASVFPLPLYGVPGVVCQMVNGRPVVAAGHGALVLDHFEIESTTGGSSNSLRFGQYLG